MKFYVFQSGDKRYEYIARMVEKDGHQLVTRHEDCDVAVLPMMSTVDGVHITGTDIVLDEFAAGMPEKSVILGSLKRETARPAFNYLVDPSLRYLNAVPTAEGAILVAMENLPRTIWNSNCLVLGRGHVGSYLAHLLKSMGAHVTMAARKQVDLDYARSMGYGAADISSVADIIGEQDIVFNAVPAPILGEKELKALRKDAIIIELAAANHAIDLELAERVGARVVVAASLPGKYSPETAGRIITDALYRTLRDNGIM